LIIFKDSQGSTSYATEYSGDKETEKSKDYSSIYSSLSGPALARYDNLVVFKLYNDFLKS